MIQEIEEYWEDGDEKEIALVRQTFWNMLHPEVVRLARSRLESGHCADSVEAVLKEVNARVKEFVKEKTRQEYDGADLMNRAFGFNRNQPISETNPIIRLDDLSTEQGKNIQQGYMQIFAGTMTGIRNPKAHGNIEINEVRAIHFLFLASLLMHKLDERKRS